MLNTWEQFSQEKLKKIFTEKKFIIDIGGGLRVGASRGNRLEETNKWLEPYIKKVDYKVLDKVKDYKPDIVADIQSLPLEDGSVDAFLCIAILEHVEEPQKAVTEMFRALRPGGYCYIYVPFLYYYHPMKGYYNDFYRFTHDGVKYLCRDFSSVEIQNVRGALSTVANLVPVFSKRTKVFDWLDRLFGKTKTKQTSGYVVFCVK